MKKEVILVPKDKCPLDVLAEMGEQTKSAWIFLHRNAVEKLTSTADDHLVHMHCNSQQFYWEATDAFPDTLLWIEIHSDTVWLKVYRIEADDIAFKLPADNPDDIIFVKMDE